MKYFCILFYLVFVLGCSNTNKQTISPRDYLEEVFKIVEEHSINKHVLDFKEIKKSAYKKLNNIDSIEKCYPIVNSILEELKDNHSRFMTKKQVDKWQSTSKNSSAKELISFNCRRINNDIGYINMKGFSSGDSISIRNYADSLQKQIELIDSKSIKGWILDLRENRGGNCWPMLSGIGPLLGNGICGYFIDNNKNKSSWFYQDGESGVDSLVFASVSYEPYKLINDLNPIAILTGHRTASSGEVIVTAFRSKSNVKSFGQSTGGYSTGNADFTLSDGSIIFLTTTIYADRKQNIFGKEIKPDEIINFLYDDLEKPIDSVMDRAMEWIYNY